MLNPNPVEPGLAGGCVEGRLKPRKVEICREPQSMNSTRENILFSNSANQSRKYFCLENGMFCLENDIFCLKNGMFCFQVKTSGQNRKSIRQNKIVLKKIYSWNMIKLLVLNKGF